MLRGFEVEGLEGVVDWFLGGKGEGGGGGGFLVLFFWGGGRVGEEGMIIFELMRLLMASLSFQSRCFKADIDVLDFLTYVYLPMCSRRTYPLISKMMFPPWRKKQRRRKRRILGLLLDECVL